MPRRPALLFIVSVALLPPRDLSSQTRELHWRSLASEARLDSTGRLHMRERQTIVFTGDWNGGERRFDIRLGQDFDFERMLRVDPATGTEHEMQQGDLSGVDQYKWAENKTLRWRSRLPSDAPFNQTELSYVLEYSLSNILIPQGDEYTLDHDFAFADRAGEFERFSLALTLDRPWRPPADFTGTFSKSNVPPGEGFTVTLPLVYGGAGRPSGVVFGAPAEARDGFVVLLAVGFLALVTHLLRRERSLGKFAPLVPTTSVDDAWLAANVFHLPPEVVGAAWDDSTGSPEVAAVLARLVSEKKVESSVTPKQGRFGRPVLHLKLLVARDTFNDYERDLIDGLFTSRSNVTDTEAVKKRYEQSGFDPAALIRPSINSILNQSRHAGRRAPKLSWKPTMVLFAVALALAVGVAVTRPRDLLWSMVTIGFALVVYGLAISQASRWQKRVSSSGRHLLRVLIPLVVLVGGVAYRFSDLSNRSGLLMIGALATFTLALCVSVINMAKSRHSTDHTKLRKHLASAREYFRHELRKPTPNLRDEWFPYFLAFGLGKQMDHWFRAFGGERGLSMAGTSRTSSGSSDFASSSSGSGSSSWSGMGGGGGFSGGGSSGAWAAAAGGMAAGVAAPSSSSSSGGGGSSGGGSSGGGGGGGW